MHWGRMALMTGMAIGWVGDAAFHPTMARALPMVALVVFYGLCNYMEGRSERGDRS